MSELKAYLSGRVVIVSEDEVNLQAKNENRILLLKIAESQSAGGRSGGLGERKVVKVILYRIHDRNCEKIFEEEGEERVKLFEVPYYVSTIPIILDDGSQIIGHGIIDKDLLKGYHDIISSLT